MPISANPPRPVFIVAKPTDPNPVDDFTSNLYRFSGYNLPLDENGFYVVEFKNQSQPADWSRRSTPTAYYGTLGDY